MRGQRGEEHYNWKGGIRLKDDGYRLVHRRGHPLADSKGYVREHRLVAQEALGKPLPRTAVLHHVNGVRDDNRRSNLVVCESGGYHRLLHKRARALAESGHVDWVRCQHCDVWAAPSEMYVHPRGLYAYHTPCRNKYQNARYHEKKKEQV